MLKDIIEPGWWIMMVLLPLLVNIVSSYAKDGIDGSRNQSSERQSKILTALSRDRHFALLAMAEVMYTAFQTISLSAVLVYGAKNIPEDLVLDWVGKSFYFYLYVAYFFITFRVFYFIKQIHILHKAYGFYLECKVLNTKTIIDMTDNKDVK